MNDWYQRQFGERETFALLFSFGRDPHPVGPPELDATWGGLAIWAAGKCLTRTTSEGSVDDSVRWNLLPILEWFLDVGIRLVNEDPFPRFSLGMTVRDGCDWFEATLSPPMLDEGEEERWFLRRSEWRHHHALRRAAPEVSLPNVVFRRVGDGFEISWDNEFSGPSRSDLTFIEPRGRVLLDAHTVSETLFEAIRDVTFELVRRYPGISPLKRLADKSEGLSAAAEDWRWLVHRPTAKLIREDMPELCARLDATTLRNAQGVFVPHTVETQLLRLVRLEHPDDVRNLLSLREHLPQAPLDASLRALIRPSSPSVGRPWEQGNESAAAMRREMGWGDEPLPELGAWLGAQGVYVSQGGRQLPPSIALVSERTDDRGALIHINPMGRSRTKRETGLATALGHVLMDESPVALDGDWEDWPTAARARAFGVALMLPEDGVRDVLGPTRSIEPEDVRRVMMHYRSGALATTQRLRNLGLINPEQQRELTFELQR